MSNKEYKYKFSVVIPIYNVEKYLEETILCVINQDIGFEKNIQMILINDGSQDNCGKICEKYRDMYPNNIKYINKENSGVSKTRNLGIKYIEGKYVNFLDSDDLWELDVFSKVWDFFEENEKKIDLVACRMRFFDAKQGYHYLDYKFSKSRIVDIHEEYSCIQLSSASVFIKEDVIREREYDTRLKISEDAKLLYEIILEKEHYGILKEAVYNYRKRFESDSAIQGSHEDVSWYIDTPKLCYSYLYELSRKKYGKVIPFIQYFIMYDLQWRIKTPLSDNLTEEQKREYIIIIKNLLKEIDDRIIWMQRNIWREEKIYALSLKYDKDIREEFEYDQGRFMFNNIEINNIKNKRFLRINILNVKKGILYLEGDIKDYYSQEDIELYVKDDLGNRYDLELFSMPIGDREGFDGNLYFKGIGFKVQIPLKKVKNIRLMMTFKKYNTKRIALFLGKFTGIDVDFKESYVVKSNYIFTTKNNKIIISKKTRKNLKNVEMQLLKYLKKHKKNNIVRMRYIYFLCRKFKKKPIWIVSDRTNVASDNGIAFFEYLVKNEKNARVYFTIEKKSPDYKRVKKIGKVLKYGSFKYKLYFLLSNKIISSQAEDWVINAFGNNSLYFRNLYKFKFVFLQHGITKDDLSSWLHKYNKNIEMFVTAVNEEYNSVVNGNYGYTEAEVKLTGFPRYDYLENHPKKQIVFMPTWRKKIALNTIPGSSEREYDDKFKNTEYFSFYNKLINDNRIINVMKNNGYKAKFCVHPSFSAQVNDFQGNEYVDIISKTEYKKEFSENSLLITDYSSVAFDFAYLHKPVIYTQFDVDTFFEGHTYDKGYFDYERDGLGPVCYDYEDTVSEIIKTIENDCILDEKYNDRINKFFAYTDKNNCKRVHEEILKI